MSINQDEIKSAFTKNKLEPPTDGVVSVIALDSFQGQHSHVIKVTYFEDKTVKTWEMYPYTEGNSAREIMSKHNQNVIKLCDLIGDKQNISIKWKFTTVEPSGKDKFKTRFCLTSVELA